MGLKRPKKWRRKGYLYVDSPRMVRTDSGQRCVYHLISRTVLDGLPFKKSEKDERVRVTRRFSMVYAVDVLGFSIMGNHFHLLIEMSPGDMLVDDEVRWRFILLYNKEADFLRAESECPRG